MLLRGDVSPEEVLDACLERFERHDPVLNAVVTLNEAATEEAARAGERLARHRRGTLEDPGLLCGLPVGIKDVTPVAGLRTTYGSPLHADHVATEDAEVVRRLRAAGAVVLGKTNTPEFAAGGHTFNRVFGVTRNPWDPSRSPGGSTGGGAAALASGMVALAEGTDLGGSLRIPAAFCGVVGLRPSPGLVPTHPTAWPWDTLEVTGPMGRTVADVGLMLQAIAGPSPASPLSRPAAGRDFAAAAGPSGGRLRLGWIPDPAGTGIEAGVADACGEALAALEGAGHEVEEAGLDLGFAREAFLALRGHWMVVHHRERLDRLDELGPSLRGNIEAGLRTTVRELADAESARARLWRLLRESLERYDALLAPCTAVGPFDAGLDFPRTIGGRGMDSYVDWIAPTFVFSLSSLPVACVPAGLDPEGLPVGLQVVGPARREELALAVAAEVERLRPLGRPPLGPLRP